MSVEKAIRARLVAHADLTALVSTRVRAAPLPQNGTFPAVSFQRITTGRTHSLFGPSGLARVRLQLDSYATTYSAVKDIADQVRIAIDGYRGTQSGTVIGGVLSGEEQDFYEQDTKLHRVSQDFIIWHQEATT